MARENKRIEALLRKELADAENKVGEIESKLNESLLQERQLHDKDIAKLQDIRNKKSQIEKDLKEELANNANLKEDLDQLHRSMKDSEEEQKHA